MKFIRLFTISIILLSFNKVHAQSFTNIYWSTIRSSVMEDAQFLLKQDGTVMSSSGYSFYGDDRTTYICSINPDGSMNYLSKYTGSVSQDIYLHIPALTELSNGDLIVAGSIDTINHGTSYKRMFYCRLNGSGNVQWAKAIEYIPAGGYGGVNRAITLNNGNVLLARGSIFTVIDTSGLVLSLKFCSQLNSVQSMVKLASGNIALLANNKTILCLDENLNLLSSFQSVRPGLKLEDLILTNDGNLACSGRLDSTGTQQYKSFFVIKMDTAGAPIFMVRSSSNITDGGTSDNPLMAKLIQMGNGDYIVASNISVQRYETIINRLDENGSLRYSRFFEKLRLTNPWTFLPYDLVRVTDSTYMVMMIGSPPSASRNFTIAGFDELDSNSCFTRKYPIDWYSDTASFNPVSLTLNAFSNFYVVNWSLSDIMYTGYSNYCVNTTDITETNHNEFIVSPNPVIDYLKIDFSTELKNVNFKIIDGSGRVVMNRNVSGKNLIIDHPDLETGIYFYTAVADNKLFSGKFIVIRN